MTTKSIIHRRIENVYFLLFRKKQLHLGITIHILDIIIMVYACLGSAERVNYM